nr:uncharacterized protein LOC112429010 [Macaca nemestrina]
MPSSGRPGRRPYLPYLSLPLGHPKPVPAKKEVSGPKGTAETLSGQAPDTCEARHPGGRTGGRPAFPSTPPQQPALPRGRNLVPARPASYRRARRLLISVAPALPPPPAAAAVAAATAGGRDTTSSGLHRHVRRAANCIVGGKGWGGGGGGRGRGRERGGPAEGRGRGRGVAGGEGEGRGQSLEWGPGPAEKELRAEERVQECPLPSFGGPRRRRLHRGGGGGNSTGGRGFAVAAKKQWGEGRGWNWLEVTEGRSTSR